MPPKKSNRIAARRATNATNDEYNFEEAASLGRGKRGSGSGGRHSSEHQLLLPESSDEHSDEDVFEAKPAKRRRGKAFDADAAALKARNDELERAVRLQERLTAAKEKQLLAEEKQSAAEEKRRRDKEARLAAEEQERERKRQEADAKEKREERAHIRRLELKQNASLMKDEADRAKAQAKANKTGGSGFAPGRGFQSGFAIGGSGYAPGSMFPISAPQFAAAHQQQQWQQQQQQWQQQQQLWPPQQQQPWPPQQQQQQQQLWSPQQQPWPPQQQQWPQRQWPQQQWQQLQPQQQNCQQEEWQQRQHGLAMQWQQQQQAQQQEQQQQLSPQPQRTPLRAFDSNTKLNAGSPLSPQQLRRSQHVRCTSSRDSDRSDSGKATISVALNRTSAGDGRRAGNNKSVLPGFAHAHRPTAHLAIDDHERRRRLEAFFKASGGTAENVLQAVPQQPFYNDFSQPPPVRSQSPPSPPPARAAGRARFNRNARDDDDDAQL